jgi:hypothetical protein
MAPTSRPMRLKSEDRGRCSFQERWTCTALPGAGKFALTYSPLMELLMELGRTTPRGFSPRDRSLFACAEGGLRAA